jgi:hypothetical protein
MRDGNVVHWLATVTTLGRVFDFGRIRSRVSGTRKRTPFDLGKCYEDIVHERIDGSKRRST